jgi:Flp pilus assembly protein TadG
MKHRFGISSEKGQSAVEFALVLPLLLVLLLGIIEFGWFLNAKITITGAAREGARHYAIHKNDTAGVEIIVNKYLNPAIVSSTTVNATTTDSTTTPVVKMAVVTVTGQVSGITGAFNSLMAAFFGGEVYAGNKIIMTSSASMRIEYSLSVASP